MAWYIIYRTSTGMMVSEADDPAHIADPLPADHTSVQIASRPDWSAQQWNSATRVVENKLAPSPSADQASIDALLSKSPVLWTNADIANALKLALKVDRREL